MGLKRCCLCSTTFSVALIGVIFGLALQKWPRGCCEHFWPDPDSDVSADSCPQKSQGVRLQDLQEKGFAILPEFITQDQVAHFMRVSNAKEEDLRACRGCKAGLKEANQQDTSPLHSQVMDLLGQIVSTTDIDTGSRIMHNCHDSRDAVTVTGQFFHSNVSVEGTPVLSWHQDTELGYKYQEPYHHLSLYIFLEKPFPNSAGLTLLPYDAIRRRSKALYDRFVGTGSRDFHIFSPKQILETFGKRDIGFDQKTMTGNITTFVEHETDTVVAYHGDLMAAACTPDLKPGDAILFRGDTFHRTQEHTQVPSWRTSLNVRISSVKQFSYWRFFSGGHEKAKTIFRSPNVFIPEIACHQMAKIKLCDTLFGNGAYRSPCQHFMHSGLTHVLSVGVQASYGWRRALWEVRNFIADRRGELMVSR